MVVLCWWPWRPWGEDESGREKIWCGRRERRKATPSRPLGAQRASRCRNPTWQERTWKRLRLLMTWPKCLRSPDSYGARTPCHAEFHTPGTRSQAITQRGPQTVRALHGWRRFSTLACNFPSPRPKPATQPFYEQTHRLNGASGRGWVKDNRCRPVPAGRGDNWSRDK